MLKKSLKFLEKLIICGAFTYLYVFVAHYLIKEFWKFNILSFSSWKIIGSFWEQGGAIKTGKDFLFALSLIILVPLWVWGLIRIKRIKMLDILRYPFYLYIKAFGEKTSSIPSITLKNMGVSKKMTISDMIDEKMQQSKESKESSADEVRKSIQDKLKSIK